MKLPSQSDPMRVLILIVSTLIVVVLMASVAGFFLLVREETYPPHGFERFLTGLWVGLGFFVTISRIFWYLTIPTILATVIGMPVLWRMQRKGWHQIVVALKRPAIVFLGVSALLLIFILVYPLYRIEIAKERLHLLNQNMNPGLALSTLGLSAFTNGGKGSGSFEEARVGHSLIYGHHLSIIYQQGIIHKVQLDDRIWTSPKQ